MATNAVIILRIGIRLSINDKEYIPRSLYLIKSKTNVITVGTNHINKNSNTSLISIQFLI